MSLSLSYRYVFVLSLASLATALGLSVATRSATAATYNDATGDNYGGAEVDISSVVVTNDASNITFKINTNPSADLSANHFANYEIGIQVGSGAGGQTLFTGTFGTTPANPNPYGNNVGISTGVNYWIGSFLDNTSANPGTGGAQLYSFSTVTGWAQVGSTAPITEVYSGTPSTTFSFPLSALGLSAGNTIKFDVWTSFGSPQGAYDALDNTTGTPNSGGLAPYSGGAYDSATASGSVLASYTVAVPEPCSIVLVAIGGCGLLAFGARRRASQQ